MIMRLLATLLLLLLATTATHAADPAQPKVGPTTVINATNGYGGVLTVRTQLNVGYAGQQGYVDIQSTNGTYSMTMTVDSAGNLLLTGIGGNTNLVVADNNDWDGTATVFLAADGRFHAAGGGVIVVGNSISLPNFIDNDGYHWNVVDATNVSLTISNSTTINPTDGYVPYRSSSTVFDDSPIGVLSVTNITIPGQLIFGPGTTNYMVRSNADFQFVAKGGIKAVVDSTGMIISTNGYRTGTGGINSGGYTAFITSGGNIGGEKLSIQSPTVLLDFIELQKSQLNLNPGSSTNFSFVIAATNQVFRIGELSGSGPTTAGFVVDYNRTTNETATLIQANGSIQRISVGDADSGGAGFRVLRIPN